MTHFARTGNAVPVRADAVPCVEIEIFRREVLQAIAADGRLLLLTGLSQKNGETRLLAAIAGDARGEIALASTIVGGAYPALTMDCPAAHHFEREIHEQWGVDPQGHPWLKPVRFPSAGPTIGKADFFTVAGAEIHEVAVGPVHAGVIEPGHFRFNCHGEQVIHLEISLGYQHRGIERALQDGPHRGTAHLAETIVGDIRSATPQPIARSSKVSPAPHVRRARAAGARWLSSWSGSPIISAIWGPLPATSVSCRRQPIAAGCAVTR